MATPVSFARLHGTGVAIVILSERRDDAAGTADGKSDMGLAGVVPVPAALVRGGACLWVKITHKTGESVHLCGWNPRPRVSCLDARPPYAAPAS